jgi:hypothetical protein
MKELKVAVGITGRVVVLEQFPDDEEHAGLHEMLAEIEIDSSEVEYSAGIYMATFQVEQTSPRDPSDIEAYLDIVKMETIPDYFERICLDTTNVVTSNSQNTTNVVDLNSIRNIRDANESLEEIVEFMDEGAQAQAKAEMDLERKHAAALNKHITLGDLSKDQFDSYDIYLRSKNGEHVGLHAIGYAGQYDYTQTNLDQSIEHKSTDFQVVEVWGNEYDAITGEMVGRGSFRVFTHDLESVAKEYETEGWTRCEKPGKLSKNT